MVLGPNREAVIVPAKTDEGSLTEVIDNTPFGISVSSVARRSGFLSTLATRILLLYVNRISTVYSTSL